MLLTSLHQGIERDAVHLRVTLIGYGKQRLPRGPYLKYIEKFYYTFNRNSDFSNEKNEKRTSG